MFRKEALSKVYFLSIIIPIYNGEKYIKRCIKSLLNQKIKNYEIIIVNNGSTDNSEKICCDILKWDNRIKFINSIEKGVSRARNIGIKYAKGNLIAFVDCDDRVDENMYFDLINILNNGIDFVICSYFNEYSNYLEEITFYDHDVYLNKSKIKYELIPRMLSKLDSQGKRQKIIGGSVWKCIFNTRLIKKNEIKFNENLNSGEDFCFLLNYLVYVKNVFITNKSYYFYNKTEKYGESITNNYMKSLINDSNIVEKEISMILNKLGFNDLENSKTWMLRKVTIQYNKIINECHINSNKNIFEQISIINRLISEESFLYNLNKLNQRELCDLRPSIIFCIKYKLSIIIVLFYYIKKFLYNKIAKFILNMIKNLNRKRK